MTGLEIFLLIVVFIIGIVLYIFISLLRVHIKNETRVLQYIKKLGYTIMKFDKVSEKVTVNEDFTDLIGLTDFLYTNENDKKIYFNIPKFHGCFSDDKKPFFNVLKEYDFDLFDNFRNVIQFYPFGDGINPVFLETISMKNTSKLGNIIILVKDVSNQKYEEELLKFNAFEDALTGAHNKLAFDEKYSSSGLEHSNIISVKLEDFKNVNDTYGYNIGNECLKLLKDRLDEFFAQYAVSNYSLYRYSGDHFIINYSLTKTNDSNFIKHFKSMLRNPFLIEDTLIELKVYVGVINNFQQEKSLSDLHNTMNIAMYNAKITNQKIYVINDTLERIENLHLQSIVDGSITPENVVPYVQPIYDYKSKKIYSYEVFFRLKFDDLIVEPSQFYDVALLSKTLDILDLALFEKSIKYISKLVDEDKLDKNIKLNFNISLYTLISKTFVTNVLTILENSLLDYSNITFELNDFNSEFNVEISNRRLSELSHLGLNFWLDSIGIQNMNMTTYNLEFINGVKYSSKLLFDSQEDTISKLALEYFTKSFKSKKIESIVVGIENEELENTAKKMKSKFVQGHLYSKPEPIEEIFRFKNNID